MVWVEKFIFLKLCVCVHMCVLRVCMFFLNLLRFSIYIFLSDFRSSFMYLIVVSIKRGRESTCESAFSSFLLLFQRKIEKRVIHSFDTQKGFGYNCFSLSPLFTEKKMSL